MFRCPHCGVSRAYAHRRLRRFFSLLHLPLVPLKGEVEFVQCGFCRRAFEPTVLETPGGDDAARRRRLDMEHTGAAATTLLVWGKDIGTAVRVGDDGD